MKTAVIQARMTSSRLPGKVLAQAAGRPMLELMIERLRRAKGVDAIVIATTDRASDDPVEALARRLGIGVFRGSEDDVRGRVLGALRAFGASVHIELTGDCPLLDPAIVDRVIAAWDETGADYVANDLEESYPLGMAVAVYRTAILADAEARGDEAVYREHPSLFICRHPELYRLVNVAAPASERRPDLRLTLDTVEDLAVIRAVFEAMRPDSVFTLGCIIGYLDAHPEITRLNAHVTQRRA